MLPKRYMKTNFLRVVSVCSVVALLGAGCTSSAPVETAKPAIKPLPAVQTKPVVENTLKPVAEVAPEATTAPDTALSPDRTVAASELPIIDPSWKTYSNTALNFSFQYATKGRYAPEFEVQMLQATDARLTGGCMNPEAKKRSENSTVTVGDSTFCIVREEDAGAGQRYFTDSFTAPRGERIILIKFNKRLAVGDLFDDVACHGKLVISSGTTCIPFDEALYRAHINQIVSTYRHE